MSNVLKTRSIHHSFNNVVPLRASASKKARIENPQAQEVVKETLEKIEKSGDEDKRLGNGWYKLSPFLNSWVKVLDTEQKLPSTVWIAVYVKEHSSVHLGVPHKPVPKTSLIYQYILSKEPKKQKTLQAFERAVVEEFLNAKKFLPLGHLAQTGIEIVKQKKDMFMSVRGLLGIGVAYPYVDEFLRTIEKRNERGIRIYRNFFKSGFVHEIVHQLRNEFSTNEDCSNEIASHAIDILSTMGDNPFKDDYLKWVIGSDKKLNREDVLYHKDVIAAMKVVKHKLASNVHCQYIPRSHLPDELNKAMKSIPENIREKVLGEIAKEIVKTSVVELLREAAGISVVCTEK